MYAYSDFKNSSQNRELFLFSIFSYYGTYDYINAGISIIRAQQEHIDGIITLRAWESNLKPLPDGYTEYVQEFYTAWVQDIMVGCIRVFPPSSYPETIELGSFVIAKYTRWYGISCPLIHFVEDVAKYVGKILISVTDNPKLEAKYQKLGWTRAHEQYPKRAIESPMKRLWVKKPT